MKKYYWLIIVGLPISILVPLGIDKFILANNYISNVDNTVWMSFFGSYIGSIIGAAATVFGIIVTLNETRRQFREDKRIEHAPFLKIDRVLEKEKETWGDLIYVIDENAETNIGIRLKIVNIGLGTAFDLRVVNLTFINNNGDEINNVNGDGECSTKEILEVGVASTMKVSIFYNIPNIEKNEFVKSGRLAFDLIYKDIMENEYIIHIKLNLGIGYNFLQKKYDVNFDLHNVTKTSGINDNVGSLANYCGKRVRLVGIYNGPLIKRKSVKHIVNRLIKRNKVLCINHAIGITGFDIKDDYVYLLTNTNTNEIQIGDKVRIYGLVVKYDKLNWAIKMDSMEKIS